MKAITFRLTQIRLLTWLVCGLPALSASANPSSATVVYGAPVDMSTQGNTLTITTTSNKTILDWQHFSIAAGETTHFIQPSSTSSVLNRVLANEPSTILGTLQSNGKVFLINPYGILVGAGAHIDVAGFVASTLNISNQDFLDGRFNFAATPGAGAVKIEKDGSITTPEGGSVYLIAPEVENGGIITTPGGETLLAAGQTVRLADTGTPGVSVEITGSDTRATNLGQVLADAGTIGMAGALVRQAGTLDAGSVVREGGRIFLRAARDATLDAGSVTAASGAAGGWIEIASDGTTLVSGTVAANGSADKGGTVHVLGNLVGLIGNALVSANGATGGGTVLVGGDYQGKTSGIHNADRTYVGKDVRIRANALASGDGGKVIVWADDTTRYYGHIDAQGGAQSGKGGFIEVSGKGYLDFRGTVDTLAPKGEAGILLLDPTNISIVLNDTTPPNTELTGQLFEESGTVDGASEITVAALHAALSSGNVTISTASTANAGGDITFANNFDFNGIGSSRTLTLQANNSITFNANVSDSVSGGDLLNLVLIPDSDNNNSGAVYLSADINLGGGLFNASGKKVIVDESVASIGSNFIADIVEMTVSASLTLNGTSTIGTLTIDDSAFTNNGIATVETLQLSSGSVNTGGSGKALTVSDLFSWDHGTVTGGGGFTVSGNASFANTVAGAFEMALTNQAITIDGDLAIGGRYWLDTTNGQLTVNGATTIDTSLAPTWTDFYGISGHGTTDTVRFLGGVNKTAGLAAYDIVNVDMTLGGAIQASNTVNPSAGNGYGDLVFDLGTHGVTMNNVNFSSAANNLIKLAGGNYTATGNIAMSGAGDLWVGNRDGRTPTFTLQSGSTLTNNANLEISGGATFNNAGTLTNNDQFVVYNNAGNVFNNTGTFINTGSMTTRVPFILAGGAVYKGAGTFNGDFDNTGGIVAPGNSPGVMTINGNYTQGPGGTLLIELGGYATGSYDQLIVNGIVNLDGTLQVALVGGFAPTVGSFFDYVVVGNSGFNGTFSNLVFPAGYVFEPSYYIPSPYYGDMHLGTTQAPSGIPGALTGQPILGTQAAGGPFYGVTYPGTGGIAGTTNDPVIVGGIIDQFVPAGSPFAEGMSGGGTGVGAADGGFIADESPGSETDLPIATRIPFPLFYDKDDEYEENQVETPRFRRPFGVCAVGGGI